MPFDALDSHHALDVEATTPVRVVVRAIDRGTVHVLRVRLPDGGLREVAVDDELARRLEGADPRTTLIEALDPVGLVQPFCPAFRVDPASRFATCGPRPIRPLRPPPPRPPLMFMGGGGGTTSPGGTAARELLAREADVYPHVHVLDSHEVRADALIELGVSLDAVALAADEAGMALAFAAGAEHLDVHASVSSPHFGRPANEDWSQTIRVDRELTAEPDIWLFRARVLGERPSYLLTVTFIAAGRVLGAVEARIPHRDFVESGPPERSYRGRLVLPRTSVVGARLRVEVAREGCQLFRFRLFQDDQPWETTDIPWSFENGEYFSRFENARDGEQLLDLAIDLAAVLPRPVVEFLDRPGTEGRETLFVSDGRVMPFELLQLRPAANGPLLGIDRPVSRWTAAHPMAAACGPESGKVACIRPVYSGADALPSAEREEEMLQGLYGDRLLPVARTVQEAVALLQDDTIGLLHFSGHAHDNPAQLVLQDGYLPINRFRPFHPLMRDAHPLIVLNGCRTGGGEGNRSTLAGNFAGTLLFNGCSALIAPVVAVRSTAARAASEVLYAALSHGATIADAVRQVRARALDDGVTEEERASLLSYLAFTAAGATLPAP